MFAIAPYIFSVVDNKEVAQDLNNINGLKFEDILSNYLKSIKDVPKVISTAGAVHSKSFIFRDKYKGCSGAISGIFQTGTQGFESEIYNFTSKTVSHKRVKEEGDMLPFHFSIYIPQSSKKVDRLKGLILLSRFNTLGIRKFVIPDLQNHFASAYPGLKLNVERFVPEALLTAFLQNSKVKTIRLIRSSLPKDFADKFSSADQKKVLDFECVIRPKRKTWFDDINWALQALDKKFNPKAVLSLGEYTPDRVKIELVNGGKKRTVDLANLGRMSSNVSIDHVKPGPNGFISAKDWLSEADELADEVFQSWDVTLPKWQSEV